MPRGWTQTHVRRDPSRGRTGRSASSSPQCDRDQVAAQRLERERVEPGKAYIAVESDEDVELTFGRFPR